MLASGRSSGMRMVALVLLWACGLEVRTYAFAGGTGTPDNPYQIATVEDLLSIGSDGGLMSKCFVLVKDLDLDPNLPGGRVFDDALISRDGDPSVSGSSGGFFRGVFDGRGHTIWHLCLGGKYGRDAGLFGDSAGVIRNLHLQDVKVSGAPCGGLVGLNSGGMILHCSVTGTVTGSYCVGGLAGRSSGLLIGCEMRGEVTGDADSIVGGLVAMNLPSSQTTECHADGTVSGGEMAGGLIGQSWSGRILRCGAVCRVMANGPAGGLVGRTFGYASPSTGVSSLLDCYTRGSVAGTMAGGLIGKADQALCLLNCYCACETFGLPDGATPPLVGGLLGAPDRSLDLRTDGCFWDAQRSQVAASTGSVLVDLGTGLITAQMQQRTLFEQDGWDFERVWTLPEGDYPVLRWKTAQVAEN